MANKQLLGAFFIESKESGLEVKPKWLMRVMSIRKVLIVLYLSLFVGKEVINSILSFFHTTSLATIIILYFTLYFNLDR